MNNPTLGGVVLTKDDTGEIVPAIITKVQDDNTVTIRVFDSVSENCPVRTVAFNEGDAPISKYNCVRLPGQAEEL